MAITTQLEPPLEPPPNRSRQRWALGLSAALLIGIAAWPASSYIGALTYPGEASFTVRTVEWVRDHGCNWSGVPPNPTTPSGLSARRYRWTYVRASWPRSTPGSR